MPPRAPWRAASIVRVLAFLRRIRHLNGACRLLAAGAEELAQEAGRDGGERVHRQARRRRLPEDAEIDGEQALVAAATEERPKQRHLREGVVEAEGGNEGAGDVELVA